jgi:hypothetical protein
MSTANQYQRPVGATSSIEFAFHFIAWVAQRRQPPSRNDLMNRYGMSKATALRYLQAYREAQLHDHVIAAIARLERAATTTRSTQ